jgi:hypothetical protein
MTESGSVVSDMVEELSCGLMGLATRADGALDELRVLGSSLILRVRSMKVSGETTRRTALVCTYILMAPNMKETGIRIFSMVVALKVGQTIRSSLVSTRKVERTALASTYGRMVPCTRDSGRTTR